MTRATVAGVRARVSPRPAPSFAIETVSFKAKPDGRDELLVAKRVGDLVGQREFVGGDLRADHSSRAPGGKLCRLPRTVPALEAAARLVGNDPALGRSHRGDQTGRLNRQVDLPRAADRLGLDRAVLEAEVDLRSLVGISAERPDAHLRVARHRHQGSVGKPQHHAPPRSGPHDGVDRNPLARLQGGPFELLPVGDLARVQNLGVGLDRFDQDVVRGGSVGRGRLRSRRGGQSGQAYCATYGDVEDHGSLPVLTARDVRRFGTRPATV